MQRELQDPTQQPAPGEGHHQGFGSHIGPTVRGGAGHDEGHHQGPVPHDRRDVRDEEAPVGVQDAQRPCGQDQGGRHREEDPEDPGQEPLGVGVPSGHQDPDQEGRRHHTDQRGPVRRHRQETQYGPGEPSRFRLLPLFEEARVDRDEGRGEGSLPQEVLEEVRGLQPGEEDLGLATGAQVEGDGGVPDDPREPAEEDAGPDPPGRTGRGGRAAVSPRRDPLPPWPPGNPRSQSQARLRGDPDPRFRPPAP